MARRSAASSAEAPAPRADMRLCILIGPEEMRKREYLDLIRDALRKEHGDFDTIFFPGVSSTLAQVLDEVRTYSLLQPFKLVLVDEAEEFVKRPGHREALERYAQSPAGQALLVLRSQSWHAGKLDKLVEKVGAVVRCDPLPRDDVAPWLIRRGQCAHGCELAPRAAAALVDRLGTDLMRLDSELAKLAIQAPRGKPIDVEAVQELVGRSSDEKAWTIQAAIIQAMLRPGPREGAGNGAGREMIEKVHELVDLAGNDEVPVQYAVADLMRKLAYAAIMRRQGAGPQKIAQALGLWGPARDAVLGLSQRIEPAQARRWFDRAMELDLRSRSSLGQSLRNLECFCAALADEL